MSTVKYALDYMFSHNFWGLCAWDIPALIVLVLMILTFILHRRKMKKREEEFEEELEEREREVSTVSL